MIKYKLDDPFSQLDLASYGLGFVQTSQIPAPTLSNLAERAAVMVQLANNHQYPLQGQRLLDDMIKALEPTPEWTGPRP